jgi:hypothetical protein
LPEGDDICALLVDVLTIECDDPFNTGVRDKLVQAVEGSEKSRFATSRRPDQSSDLAFSDNNMDIFEGLSRTVIKIKPASLYLYDRSWFRHEYTYKNLKPFNELCLKLSDYNLSIKRILSFLKLF